MKDEINYLTGINDIDNIIDDFREYFLIKRKIKNIKRNIKRTEYKLCKTKHLPNLKNTYLCNKLHKLENEKNLYRKQMNKLNISLRK